MASSVILQQPGTPAPPLSWTPLEKIFKGIKSPFNVLRPYQVHHMRRSHPALMGTILMACVAEQTRFLTLLWAEKFPPDDDVTLAWKSLAYGGRVPDLLDPSDAQAKDLFITAYNAVMIARGKL